MSAVQTSQRTPLTSPPAPSPAERDAPQHRRWTRQEFYKMAALGWFKGKRVVLLDGEIIEMPGQGNWHTVAVGKGERALLSIFPQSTHWVRVQSPLDLPDERSEPEPDLVVVSGQPDDYQQHPSTGLLVVEVADSSLRLDRRKAHAYARAGIADYWIVNLPDHVLEVYRDPLPDAAADLGYRYGSTVTLRVGETISPLANPLVQLPVADFLPARPVVDSF